MERRLGRTDNMRRGNVTLTPSSFRQGGVCDGERMAYDVKRHIEASRGYFEALIERGNFWACGDGGDGGVGAKRLSPYRCKNAPTRLETRMVTRSIFSRVQILCIKICTHLHSPTSNHPRFRGKKRCLSASSIVNG